MGGVGGFASHLRRARAQRFTMSGVASQNAMLEEFSACLAAGKLRSVAVGGSELNRNRRSFLA